MNADPDRTTGPDDAARLLGRLRPTGPARPVGGAALARRTAGRRQALRLGGAALLVAAVITGVPVGLSLQTTSAPAPVATQEPSPLSSQAPSTPADPSPAPSPTPSGASTTPSPVPPTSSAAPPPSPSPTPSLSTPPALVVAATAVGPSRAGELASFEIADSEWFAEGDGGGTASWQFDPCSPTDYPQDAQRTGWAATSNFLGDGGQSRAVASYPSPEVAAEVVLAFARVAEACWEGPTGSGEDLWQTLSSTDEAMTGVSRRFLGPTAEELANAAPGSPPTLIRGAAFTSVVRVGRHVALVQGFDDYGGGSVAAAQGDTREGAGSSFSVTPEQARVSLDSSVQRASDEARRLATEAAAHVGDGS